MLTEKQINEIKEHLEKAQNPVFFYDNDPDGLCSFLLLQRYIDDGVGGRKDQTQQGQACPDCNSKYAVYNIVKTIPQNTLPLKIGKDDAYWKKTLNAKVDEVRYYNRALTSDEVKKIYSGTL
ncbi:MAG: hypothetical protein AAB866_02620 [Patescibacteria group bacterium]